MLNIYDADGHLDRGRVLDALDEILGDIPTLKPVRAGITRKALVDLLDECSEGYTHDPLTAPTMVTEYINACKPVTNHQRRA